MGASRIYKENEVLFREGDASDGMYLVRSGELKVYLEKDGNETQLAIVGPGGMIGEMAFFEEKPRSASVKAVKQSEITKISNQDFEKLIKQIPKWFVSLMGSLSGRLRLTNERLQNIEGSAVNGGSSYTKMTQIFHILELIVHKHGFKDGKEMNLSMEKAAVELQTIFGYEPAKSIEVLKSIAESGVIGSKKDPYNNDVLVFKKSHSIDEFLTFVDEFKKDYAGLSYLPENAIAIMEYAYELAKESPYEKATIAVLDIIQKGEKELKDVSDWKNQVRIFKSPKPFLQLVKMGPGAMGFRVERKELRNYIRKVKILTQFHKAGLDR